MGYNLGARQLKLQCMSSNEWVKRLQQYRSPDNKRASLEIVITLIPFVLVWVACWQLLEAGYWLGLLLILPNAGLLVRLFIIQHDCGHGSLFSSREAMDWVGRLLGIMTFTPYEYWRRLHATHHAGSGNLDRRGWGEIDTLTINEYQNLGLWARLRYRLYRNPFVMFGLGPAYLFLFRHRIPIGAMNQGKRPWISALATNAGILLVSAIVIQFTGLKWFLIIQIPTVILAASIGIWMFYVQHQFEDAHFRWTDEWTHPEAALMGSSFYDLPKPFMWITGNIGIHHVHHLSSRIPFHKLPMVLREHPELKKIGRMTFLESLKCVKLALWDEKTHQLVSFKSLKSQAA